MATKKGNREALLAALESLNDQTLRDDEFTVEDFIKEAREAGKAIIHRTARANLQSLAEKGVLNRRPIVRNGKVINAYSKP